MTNENKELIIKYRSENPNAIKGAIPAKPSYKSRKPRKKRVKG